MSENKIITGMKEAIAHAKGTPVEGTRESWFSQQDLKWHSRTFKDGKWIGDNQDDDKERGQSVDLF